MLPRISTISPIGGERSNAADAQAVRRQTTVTRAPRSRARLIPVTTRRSSWRSHVHRTYTAQRVQPFKPQTANAIFLWVGLREGYLFFEKRYPSLVRTVPAGAVPPPPPCEGNKQKGSPRGLPFPKFAHSTVTDFARFLGLSISHPRWSAI